MKKAGIILMITILSGGCTLEDLLEEFAPDMSAKIDGIEWNTTLQYTALEEGKFIITGTSIDGKSLSITIIGNSPGAYELSLTSSQCGAIYKTSPNSTNEDVYLSVSGTVNLSVVDTEQNKISGTFVFSLRRDISEPNVEITQGIFNSLTYEDNPEK